MRCRLKKREQMQRPLTSDSMTSLFNNQLLMALPEQDRQNLASHLEPVTLKTGAVLERACISAEHAYFPETALISTIVRSGTLLMEGVMYGLDGMSGTALLLNEASPFDSKVRLGGTGFRIAAKPFQEFLRTRPYSVRLFRRYAQAEHVQLAYAILATGQTKMDLRAARWLSMVRDRVEADAIKITQEDLSVLLGVHRPGVTECLHRLKGQSLIEGNRGEIAILDRRRLAALAGPPYGDAEREYARLMGFQPGFHTPLDLIG